MFAYEAWSSVSTHHPVEVLKPRPREGLLRRWDPGGLPAADSFCRVVLVTSIEARQVGFASRTREVKRINIPQTAPHDLADFISFAVMIGRN